VNQEAKGPERVPDQVDLDEIIEIDDSLIAYAESLPISHSFAVQHACWKNKALWHAHQIGWSSGRYDRHLAWEQVRKGFGDETCGCGTIIQLALDEQLLPHELDDAFMARWRQKKRDEGCTRLTIDTEEVVFRRKMRVAGLADLFPRLDLASRAHATRVPKEEELPDSFRIDLDKVEHWKTDPEVNGRPAELRVKPRAAKTMRGALKGIYQFAVDRRYPVKRFRDLFEDPEIICEYIDLLWKEHGWLATSIHAHLSSIHCLTYTYPSLKRRKYPLFTAKLKKLRKEPRFRIDERKDDSCVLYEELEQLPRGIRAKRMHSRNLTEEAIAWMVHDELFASWSLYLPWRFENIAGCGFKRPASVNIVEIELPLEMRDDPDLPAWVKRALKANPHRRFLQYIFWKSQCKNKWAVRGIIPRELIPLYRLYTTRYRDVLFKDKEDPGFLFCNRAYKRMAYDDWYNLYTCLTDEFLQHPVRPHLTRDIFSEHWLRLGRSLTGLQKLLWHRCISSTVIYARRFNASHGSVALDQEFTNKRRLARAA
jgi:hypothetical protein